MKFLLGSLGLVLVVVAASGRSASDWKFKADIVVPQTIAQADDMKLVLWEPPVSASTPNAKPPVEVARAHGSVGRFDLPPSQTRYVLTVADRASLHKLSELLAGGTMPTASMGTGIYFDSLVIIHEKGAKTLRLFESGDRILWLAPHASGFLIVGRSRVAAIKTFLYALGETHRDLLKPEPHQ